MSASRRTRRVAPLIVLEVLLATLLATLMIVSSSCDGGPPLHPSEVPATWEIARTLPGHQLHVGRSIRDAQGVTRAMECKDCHDLGHEAWNAPKKELCLTCHVAQTEHPHGGGVKPDAACVGCHDFAPHAGKEASLTCAGCHAVAQGTTAALVQHAGPATACRACHVPHTPPTVVASCDGCHVGIGAAHGKKKVVAPDADAGATLATLASVPDGGADAWLEAMREPGKQGVDGAAAICSTCHAPHAPAKAARDTCASCHVGSGLSAAATAPKIVPEQKTGKAGGKVALHEACVTCHTPHAATKTAVKACVGCHADHRAVADVAGHADCQSCHAPHSPSGANAAAKCTSCHANHQALGSPKEHAACVSCHDPHIPKASPGGACAKCHADVHSGHPGGPPRGVAGLTAIAPAVTACTGCHAPHPAKPETTVATCTSCHAQLSPKLATDHSAHGGMVACTTCHAEHGFVTGAAKPAFCAKCHASVVKAVAPNAGHADCISCHVSSHTPVRKVACNGCHAKEAATAPKGHAECRNCHDKHSGAMIVGKTNPMASPAGFKAFCLTCHAPKAKEQHGDVPGGCANCHRAHGPTGPATPPACTSCHTKATLPGLHATHSYANCASCHGGHTPPSATRETCTKGCHEAKKTHQPEAKTCTGCHVFRN